MKTIQAIHDRALNWRHDLQFEVQRMTAAGGWKRHEPYHWEGKHGPPEDDEDFLIVDPGRYREIRRVDGRIHSVLWTHETAESQAYYEEQKRVAKREKQLELVQDLSKTELLAEARDPDQLDELESIEILDQLEIMLRDQDCGRKIG